ncbi:MAG: T9SS type A sorting domain-containing protein, partial [Bacteroidota bacterium]
LLEVENTAGFLGSGFHTKDYHIYLWALLEQIDAKLGGCSSITSTETPNISQENMTIFPNPSKGTFTIQIDRPIPNGEYLLITDIYGRTVRKMNCESINRVQLKDTGVYFVITTGGSQKIIVN